MAAAGAPGAGQEKEFCMVTFINTFLSYGVLMLVMVAAGFAGGAVGRYLRQKKDSSSKIGH